jgi:hypothetical protein
VIFTSLVITPPSSSAACCSALKMTMMPLPSVPDTLGDGPFDFEVHRAWAALVAGA